MSDLPRKLPFVPDFSLRDLWRFFQKYHFFTNFVFFLRGGVCSFHNCRKSTSISTPFGYVVVPVGSLRGSMVSTPVDQSATSTRGPKFDFFAFFLRGGVCSFHNCRKNPSISTPFGYVVVPVGSLGGSMVSSPVDQSATSSRGPKFDFFAFFALEDRRTFLR